MGQSNFACLGPNPVTGTRQVHNPLHSVISQCESNENGGARGPRLGILQFIDAVRLVVPRPESVSIARTVRRVLSTSKPMVAGTSVRLPSISDSSATTNKWVWKLSPLGLRAACQLNIAKTICRSAPIRRGPQLTHECRSSHNHNCERTQVRQKSPSKRIKYVFFLSIGRPNRKCQCKTIALHGSGEPDKARRNTPVSRNVTLASCYLPDDL